MVGITVYLLLRAAKVPTVGAFAGGVIAVVGTRLAAIAFEHHLPVRWLAQ